MNSSKSLGFRFTNLISFFLGHGIATTLSTIAVARLNLTSVVKSNNKTKLGEQDKQKVVQLLMLATAYNALLPGL